MSGQGRWAGRNPGKDVVRDQVWQTLEQTGVAVGPAWSMIPNFVGADMAAWRLAQTPEWQRARTVKTNPDAPQIPIRLRALYEGKTVYAPVPDLTRDFPYLRIDPRAMKEKGISFELAATSQGFASTASASASRMSSRSISRRRLVAVPRGGGRTEGAGFADLETAIFRELGTIGPGTPIVTTVHSSQLRDDEALVIEAHDSPLDMIATELELIRTHNADRRPGGVDWERVRQDQFETIPFLAELRDRLLARRAAG